MKRRDKVLTNRKTELRPDLELQRVVTLREAAEICGISLDTIRRRYPQIIIKLSPRRVGVRLRDALSIGTRPRA
jgi:DNA-directed RNA polymerase specialized sigma24 family protein